MKHNGLESFDNARDAIAESTLLDSATVHCSSTDQVDMELLQSKATHKVYCNGYWLYRQYDKPECEGGLGTCDLLWEVAVGVQHGWLRQHIVRGLLKYIG